MNGVTGANDLVLRGRQTGLWILVIVNVVIVGTGAWRWSQGDPATSTRVFTLVFALLLLVKLNTLRHPPEARLHEGRLSFGAGFLRCSTPRENVELLEAVDGRLRVRFADLSQVEAGPTLRKLFEDNASRGGLHFALPMRPEPAALQRFRAALFEGR